jgi:exodeoxyribonuclease VII small subunit
LSGQAGNDGRPAKRRDAAGKERTVTGARKSRKDGGQEPTFEAAIGRLEAIVRELEGADIPLEKSLEMFEEGVRLSKICHQKLSEAEKKVQVLTRGASGELEVKPFGPAEPAAGGEGQDEAVEGEEGEETEDEGGENETLF